MPTAQTRPHQVADAQEQDTRIITRWHAFVAAAATTSAYRALARIEKPTLERLLFITTNERRIQFIEAHPEIVLDLFTTTEGRAAAEAWNLIDTNARIEAIRAYCSSGTARTATPAQATAERIECEKIACGAKIHPKLQDIRPPGRTKASWETSIRADQRRIAAALNEQAPKAYGDRTNHDPQTMAAAIATGAEIANESAQHPGQHEIVIRRCGTLSRKEVLDALSWPQRQQWPIHTLHFYAHEAELSEPDSALAAPGWHTQTGLIPSTLIARAIEHSGYTVAARTPTARHLHDAIVDLVVNGIVPQINSAARWTAQQWFPGQDDAKLAIGLARRLLERHLDKLAKAPRPGVRIGDFAQWTRAWHQHERLAAGQTITGTHQGQALAKPAVLDIIAELPANIERITTVDALHRIANEEKHCIGGYTYELQQGTYHALVIHTENEPRAVLTIQERLCRDTTPGEIEEYTLYDLAQQNNDRPSTEQNDAAHKLIAQWNRALASARNRQHPITISANAYEVRTSKYRRRLTPAQCSDYWDNALEGATPAWLLPLAPARAGVNKLLANASPEWDRLYRIAQRLHNIDLSTREGIEASLAQFEERHPGARAVKPAHAQWQQHRPGG